MIQQSSIRKDEGGALVEREEEEKILIPFNEKHKRDRNLKRKGLRRWWDGGREL